MGRRYLGLSPEHRQLEDHQAAAAAGQILLAHAYQELLDKRGIKIAQILVTLEDTENRRRYLNARSTIEKLLHFGVVPIIMRMTRLRPRKSVTGTTIGSAPGSRK